MKFFLKRTQASSRKPNKSDLRRQLALHLGALGLFLIAFILTLLVWFPDQVLRNRAEQLIFEQSGARISIGDLSLAPPLRLTLRNVAWKPEMQDWPEVRIPVIRVAPLWGTVFGGNPGAGIAAGLQVGSLQGQMFKDGNLEAVLAGIGIAPFLPADFAYPIQGVLSGNLKASGDLAGMRGQATFQLQLDRGGVSGLEALGATEGRLSLGTVTLRGELQGRNLRIEELRAADGDLLVEGRGTLLLAETPQASRITAQIELTPAPSLDPNLADLLLLTGVTPDRNGTYRLRLSGSLANPVLR
ncbi:type II secretion system protein GspN [Geoalkalibacter halelectricus]|uniref:Type II secretion system protein GspN n=1 Tax=Geoalkalibacter halelectricus TaxID=2847045 RepID=A0ABY5ZJ85_9BACT|nr:type II secretion system protein GspN [Geoalkalibacter halelectricus]MDO3379660.1 type II secretion system protein GspN [Geoalkalibacter halelectricus]UWZ78524.1 type II secretion system protein GspN [Geoalkalibacter halelectricus]